jgi:hypothetical protein
MKTGIAPSVKSKIKPFEMDKRTYLPGASVSAKCPTCGEKVVHDFDDQPLSYPMANKAFDLVMSHDVEGPEYVCHEFKVRITVNVSVSLTPKRVKAAF